MGLGAMLMGLLGWSSAGPWPVNGNSGKSSVKRGLRQRKKQRPTVKGGGRRSASVCHRRHPDDLAYDYREGNNEGVDAGTHGRDIVSTQLVASTDFLPLPLRGRLGEGGERLIAIDCLITLSAPT